MRGLPVAADPALVVPARSFSIGLVLRDSLRVWFTTLPKLALASVIAMAPWFGLLWLVALALKSGGGSGGTPPRREEMRETVLLAALATSLVVSLSLFAVQGAVVNLVFQKLRGQPTSVVKTV